MSALLFKTLQLELMHLATGNALMDGLEAAHFRVHAVSPHAQPRAQVWPEAQFGAARHSSIWLAHLSSEHVQASSHVALLQSISALLFKATDELPHLELTHLATGNALMLGLLAAHFSMHALSEQGHARAQSCDDAQFGADMQASISLAHCCREHSQSAWQLAFEQSMSALLFKATLQLELMHLATGNALMDGLEAAHFKVHAVSPHAQPRAQAWPEAQFGAARHSSIWLAHLSREQVHASSQVALLQSISEARSCSFFKCVFTHTACSPS